jgi:hypothetical protein
MGNKIITPDRLRECLAYDPETGIFTWRLRPSPRIEVGNQAGALRQNGYRGIQVDHRQYLAARLAWLWMTGEWPTNEIDHKNGIKDDDRWLNLRDVPRSLNQQNKHFTKNKSGYMGVYLMPAAGVTAKRWQARIQVQGKTLSLGCFYSATEAHEVYLQVKRKLHPGCTF